MAGSQITNSVRSATLADVIERILDKGLVIAGDIKIKLVDIELLTIQIRLLVASVDKAKELGIDWWRTSPFLSPTAMPSSEAGPDVAALQNRVKDLEAKLAAVIGTPTVPAGLPSLLL
jgi:hypothetical protein